MADIRDNTFAVFEERLLHCIATGVPLDTLEKDMERNFLSFQKKVAIGAFTTKQLCLFDEQAARIKHIAILFQDLERCRVETIERVEKEAQHILYENCPETSRRNEDHSLRLNRKDIAPASSIQETLNSKVLRRWFLDNVADPFPNRKTKEELITKTNALVEAAAPPVKKTTVKSSPSIKSTQAIDYTQCSLWFVNSRRRSNWTDFFREFARSDKVKMRRIVECLKREEEVAEPGRNRDLEMQLHYNFTKTEYDSDGSPIPQNDAEDMATRVKECRESYSRVMDWLHQISRDKVGDWMDEVIHEAKKQVKEEKAARKNEMKRRAEVIEKLHEERDHQKQKMEQDRQKLRAADVNVLQMDRTLRRKVTERKERAVHRRMSSGFHTPDSHVKPVQFKDSSVCSTSIGSTSWTSSAESQYAPSLFENRARPCSSSSAASSIASYDAFRRVPASPTLSILKNSHPKFANSMEPAQMGIAAPFTNTASLYPPGFTPQHRFAGIPKSDKRLLSASPTELHLETELSGVLRSRTSRAVSQSSSASGSASQFSPWNELQG